VNRIARLLALLGPFGLVWAASEYHARHIASPPYLFVSSTRAPWALLYAVLLSVAAYATGLPSLRPGRASAWAASVVAALVGAIGVSIAQLLVGSALLPRFVVVGTTAVIIPWFVICARLADDGTAKARGLTRVVVIGDLADVGSLWVELETNPERPATVVALLTPHEAEATRTSAPLIEAVVHNDGGVVVLDNAAQRDPSIMRQAAKLHERGVKIRTLTGFFEEWLGKLPISELERASLMFDIAEVHGGSYGRLKRVIDIALGLACLAVATLVAPFVAIGDRIANRGPLLYRQVRVGKGGEPFEIVKFRTMRPGPADTTWTTADDPRLGPFGRFLRRSHLDELPQGWNILRGDLSIVGPRPEQVQYVAELEAKLPFYGMRHLVRPGLTGWAQVKYGYAGDTADALEKLQYEFFYLQHQGVRLDLRIMARTVRAIIGGPGAGR